MSAMRSRIASSRTRSTPANPATTSPVRSSAVGPRPPLVTISALPAVAAHRSAASRSPGRSPTSCRCATSNPRAVSSLASHGPLASAITPVMSSLPVSSTAARGPCC